MILLIDNYDSFAFNLYQSLAGMGAHVEVVRNDVSSVEALLSEAPTAIVLSPGPGRPKDAGVCLELLRALPVGLPVLGVCLGHQSLVEFYGGCLEVDKGPVHGKASLVHHDGLGLFKGLPSPFPCGRYHSLRAVRAQLPASLDLRAWTEAGDVMAVQHEQEPHFGVQFHPESILTPQGDQLLSKFLSLAGEPICAR